MAEQATKKITHSLTGLHSMQSLGWGAVAMNQLAQLINWSGSESFKPVAVDPWTALISINSEPIQADVNSAAQAPSPTTSNASELSPAINSEKTPLPTEAEKANAEAERVAAESAAAEKLAAEKLAVEKAAEEKAAADADAKAAAERVAVAAAEQAAREKEKEEAIRAAAEKAAVDQRASAEKAAAEKLAAEQMATEQADAAQKAAEREAALERAAEQRAAEVKAAQQKAAEQKAAEQRAAEEKAAEEKAAEEKAAEEIAAKQRIADQKAAEKVATAKPVAAAAQPVVRSVSQPSRTNMPATARTATLVQVPTSIQRPVSADSSVETYLAQLEQLVLELNMELGRRDQTASDPIHDLSQRVIDLNLENLALKEQLRKSSSHE